MKGEFMKVYKGFETPCRIHGYMARDFFLLCVAAMLFALMAIMFLNSAIKSGEWIDFLIFLPLAVFVLFSMHVCFLLRARGKKYPNRGDRSDICSYKFKIWL